jgi:hypothetical protein
MKKIILRIILVTLLLGGLASVPVAADTVPVPACWPKPCPVQ